jgi:hypothetical protein
VPSKLPFPEFFTWSITNMKKTNKYLSSQRKKDHKICRWKYRSSWLGLGTKISRGWTGYSDRNLPEVMPENATTWRWFPRKVSCQRNEIYKDIGLS